MIKVITNDKYEGRQELNLPEPDGVAGFFLHLRFNAPASVFNACQAYYLTNKATLDQCLAFYAQAQADYDSDAAQFRQKWNNK